MRRLLAACLLLACGTAQAAPLTLRLTPQNFLAETHSRSLMLSFTSIYRELSGTLQYDPAARTCYIDVKFEVRSLSAPNALIHDQALSKSFLDPEDYPETHFVGTCQGAQLVGDLTLRGVTRPFAMQLHLIGPPGAPIAVHAEGSLNRYDWGLSGLPMLIGKTVRITNDISLNGESIPIQR